MGNANSSCWFNTLLILLQTFPCCCLATRVTREIVVSIPCVILQSQAPLDPALRLHRDPLEPPTMFLLNPLGRIGVAEITVAFSNLGQNYDVATCSNPELRIQDRSVRTIRADPQALLANPLPSIVSINFSGQFDSRYCEGYMVGS
jgi:hypothetical protein